MLSYRNDPDLKRRAVEAAKRHAETDALTAGTYGRMNGAFKGCSVGCDYHDITGDVDISEPHATTAEYFGFPEWLEHLRDAIFEGLPEYERRGWHVQLKEAVPVGVDLAPVRHRLAIRRLDRLIEAHDKADKSSDYHAVVGAALQQVRACHEAEINQTYRTVDWSAAKSAAESARSAAGSAWWEARSAAESAQSAWSAAESAWQQEAADLLDLLRASSSAG